MNSKHRAVIFFVLAALLLASWACRGGVNLAPFSVNPTQRPPATITSRGKANPTFTATSTLPLEAQPTPQAFEPQRHYEIGEVVQLGTIVFTVHGVSYPPGDQFIQPEAGYKFLVIDLTIENTGSSAIFASTILQMSIEDSDGQKYTIDFLATVASDGTPPDAEVLPGEKIRGQVGFQVPEDASGLVFVYRPNFLDEEQISISLP